MKKLYIYAIGIDDKVEDGEEYIPKPFSTEFEVTIEDDAGVDVRMTGCNYMEPENVGRVLNYVPAKSWLAKTCPRYMIDKKIFELMSFWAETKLIWINNATSTVKYITTEEI